MRTVFESLLRLCAGSRMVFFPFCMLKMRSFMLDFVRSMLKMCELHVSGVNCRPGLSVVMVPQNLFPLPTAPWSPLNKEVPKGAR